MFVHQVEAVRRVTLVDVERYGVRAEELEAVKQRYLKWAMRLRTLGA